MNDMDDQDDRRRRHHDDREKRHGSERRQRDDEDDRDKRRQHKEENDDGERRRRHHDDDNDRDKRRRHKDEDGEREKHRRHKEEDEDVRVFLYFITIHHCLYYEDVFSNRKTFVEIMKHCFELNVLSSFNGPFSLLMSLRTEMVCLYRLYITITICLQFFLSFCKQKLELL